MDKTPITVETIVNAPLSKVWEYWNAPEHITKWAFASDDWEARDAENDLREEGRFATTMAAKDGSTSFAFGGVYTAVKEHELIEYDMDKAEGDSAPRHVTITFSETETSPAEAAGEVRKGTKLVQTFDPETENPADMQRDGWQAIIDNFKKHVESS